jgi:hypothetical protein
MITASNGIVSRFQDGCFYEVDECSKILCNASYFLHANNSLRRVLSLL